MMVIVKKIIYLKFALVIGNGNTFAHPPHVQIGFAKRLTAKNA